MKHRAFIVTMFFFSLILLNNQDAYTLGAKKTPASDRLLLARSSVNFISDVETSPGVVVEPFSDNVITTSLPSSEFESRYAPTLRAGPDLGGDIDGGGGSGIGREEDIPLTDFTFTDILLFITLYLFIQKVKRMKLF